MADLARADRISPADQSRPETDESAKNETDNAMRPSLLDGPAAMLTFKAWFKGDARQSADWRKNAEDDFGFVAPDGQWSEEDRATLKGQRRTPIEFNRTLSIIKAIAGMEINGRHEIAYLPRKLEDDAIDETLSGASKWMADECDAEDEESEAFEDALVCGLGWTEHRMDYEEEPEGKYIEEEIDPLEMYWDRTAKKKNLTDRRRDMRVRTMPLGDAMQMFPGKTRDELDAKWAYAVGPTTPQKTLEERRVRDENSSGPLADQDEVTLVHVEWWEREECWCVADPANNKMLKVDGDTFKKLKSRHAEVQAMMAQADPTHQPIDLTAAKGFRKRYKQAFLGSELLEPISDAKDPARFSRTCVTGHLNKKKRMWFGVVRVLRDPQMWGNKWMSQTLHILNSTAKGGILAETDAFEDQRQAEETYARPDGITWMKKGALSGQQGPKIKEKPGAGNFAGYIELLNLAISAPYQVTGVNLELLGQKDMNQPGVLEAMRKQAGMTVLATIFDSLRRMRKLVGRIRLYYIQNFLSDGRIIRIMGADGAKSIQLLRDKTLGEYDVIVDDTPTSPNQKQATWGIISNLLPAFKDQLMARPDVFMAILRYSPLPTQLVSTIEQLINAQPTGDQAQAKQLATAAQVAKISKDQAQAELFLKQAASTEATAMYDQAMAQNLLLKHQGDMAAAMNEVRKTAIDASKAQAETTHLDAKTATERAKAGQIVAQTVGAHASAAGQHVANLIDALTPIPHVAPGMGPDGMPIAPAGAQ
jgi:hypothetical protein